MNQNRKIVEVAQSLVTGGRAPGREPTMPIARSRRPPVSSRSSTAPFWSLPRREASPRTGNSPRPRAGNILGQHPRPHCRRPFRRRAHAGADADRRQPALTPLAVPLVAPMALGLGGNAVTVSMPLWDAMAAARRQPGRRSGKAPAMPCRAVVADGQAAATAAAVRRGPSAFRAQLRAALLACRLRRRPRPRRRDRRRAAALDGGCAERRPHRRLLRRRAMEQPCRRGGRRAHRHGEGRHLAIQPGKGARPPGPTGRARTAIC